MKWAEMLGGPLAAGPRSAYAEMQRLLALHGCSRADPLAGPPGTSALQHMPHMTRMQLETLLAHWLKVADAMYRSRVRLVNGMHGHGNGT